MGSFYPLLGVVFPISWGHFPLSWGSFSPLLGVVFPIGWGHFPGSSCPLLGVMLPSAGKGGGIADLAGGWGGGGRGRHCRFSGGGEWRGGGGEWGGRGWWCGVSLSSHCLEPNHGFLAAIIHHISCIINPHHISGYHLLATKQADIEMGPPNAGAWEAEARSMAAPPCWYSEGWGGPAPDLWTLVH